MPQVNILEAKTDFSEPVRLPETKKEDCITVARNGKPVVKITRINEIPVSNRIGIGKGKFTLAGDLMLTTMRSPMRLWEARCESPS